MPEKINRQALLKTVSCPPAEPMQKLTPVHLRCGLKMSHLPLGVDFCIGSAGPDYGSFFVGDLFQAILKDFLDGDSVGLNLPSVIAVPVIFDDDFKLPCQNQFLG